MITSYKQQYENYISFILQSKGNLLSEIKQAFYDIIKDTSLNKNLGDTYDDIKAALLTGPRELDYKIKENQIKTIINLAMLNRFDTYTLKEIYKNSCMFNFSILFKILDEEYRGLIKIGQVEIQEKPLEELQKLSLKLKMLGTKLIDKEISTYYITENREAILVYEEESNKLIIYTTSIALLPNNALITYEAPYRHLTDMLGKRFKYILEKLQTNTLEEYQIPIKITYLNSTEKKELNTEEVYNIYRNIEAEKVKSISHINKLIAENYSELNLENLVFKMLSLYKIPSDRAEEFIQQDIQSNIININTIKNLQDEKYSYLKETLKLRFEIESNYKKEAIKGSLKKGIQIRKELAIRPKLTDESELTELQISGYDVNPTNIERSSKLQDKEFDFYTSSTQTEKQSGKFKIANLERFTANVVYISLPQDIGFEYREKLRHCIIEAIDEIVQDQNSQGYKVAVLFNDYSITNYTELQDTFEHLELNSLAPYFLSKKA